MPELPVSNPLTTGHAVRTLTPAPVAISGSERELNADSGDQLTMTERNRSISGIPRNSGSFGDYILDKLI
jgi:hypothetical protein